MKQKLPVLLKSRSHMKQFGWIFIGIFLFFYFVFNIQAEAAFWNHSSGSIDAAVGFRNYVKPGKYLPVQIYLDGAYAMLPGTVELSVPTGEEDYYLYKKTFAANPSGVTVDFLVPTSCTDNHMAVTLLDSKDETVSSKTLSYDINYMDARIFSGVITNQYSQLDYWNQLYLSGYNLGGYSQQLFTSDIPQNSLALDMFDIIMIDNFSCEQLTDEQWNVLWDWVSDGGILVSGTGAVNFSNYLPDSILFPDSILLPTVRHSLSQCLYGNGRIFMANCSLSALSGYFYADSNNIYELVELLFGEEKLNTIYKEQNGSIPDSQSEAIHQTTQVQASRHLNLSVYAAILIIYIVFLLPFIYFLLKKRDLLQYLRIFITSSAFVFAGIIFLLGSKTRFSHPFINYFSIETYENQTKSEAIYTGIQAPYNQSYDVSVSNDYHIIPMQQSSQWMLSDYQSDRNHTVVLSSEGTEQLLTFQNLVAFTPRNFLFGKTTALSDSEAVTSNVSFYNEKLSGTLKNNLGINLEHAILALPGYITTIGTFSDTEEISLENYSSKLYQTASYYQPEDLTAILSDSASDSDLLQKRLNLLSYYLQLCDRRHENRGFLIGFTQAVPNFQKNTSYETNGLTLSVIPIEVNTSSGSFTDSLLLPADTSIISGEFSENSTKLLEGEYGVIRYHFYSSFVLESLKLFFSNEAASVSEVYFYKPKTESYIQVYPGQSTFSSDELKEYMDNQTLSVKYHSNSPETYLPRLIATGRNLNAGN